MKTPLIVATLMFTACVAESDSSWTDEPRLSVNSLTPTAFFNTTLDAGVLDQTNLDTMAATADGRTTLHYVIPCALAAGHTVTANYLDDQGQPQTINFGGVIGLADSWTSTALSTASQRWVTACTLSLVNELGSAVTISQRGPSSALSTTSQELSGYTLQEGAFFGNMFKGGEGVAACKGSGTSSQSGRTCTRNAGNGATYCGFTYVGLCSSVCSTSSGYFVNCSWNSTTYSTPVSTYLTN